MQMRLAREQARQAGGRCWRTDMDDIAVVVKRVRAALDIQWQIAGNLIPDIRVLVEDAERHMEAPADRTAELHAEIDRLDRLAEGNLQKMQSAPADLVEMVAQAIMASDAFVEDVIYPYKMARDIRAALSGRIVPEGHVAVPLAEHDAAERLRRMINSPELLDFHRGVAIEGAHQVERWGEAHDRNKAPEDWFWLVGYLAGKALAACRLGDTDKALHHCISTAAALAQWHAHVKGGGYDPGKWSDLEAALGMMTEPTDA